MQGKRSRPHARQLGVTLIEVCATLAIISILVGTAAPSFQEVMQRRALDGAAAELASDLHFARSEAVARQEGVRFAVQPAGGGSCVLIHTGANGDCQCAGDGSAQCSNGASLVKTTFYPSTSRVSVAANVSAIRFEPHNGIATPAGTVTVTTPSGHALRHVVNIMGRVRTCSPGATSMSAKPC